MREFYGPSVDSAVGGEQKSIRDLDGGVRNDRGKVERCLSCSPSEKCDDRMPWIVIYLPVCIGNLQVDFHFSPRDLLRLFNFTQPGNSVFYRL